jgi:hypothetical protein
MAGKITEYPNQATSFGVDDKFDISQKTGVSTYQSRWYSPATLYAMVVAFITSLFVRQFTLSRASLQSLISSNGLIVNAKYIINNAEGGTKYIVVYATSVNTITEYCYLLNNPGVSFLYSSVGRYNITSDEFYPVDNISADGHLTLLLYFNGGYFKRGQTIELSDAQQGAVRVFTTDSNSTSVAAMLPGNQDGGNTPDVQGYWGKYDPINDVFVHDIVHFRTEIVAAIINTATSPIDVDIEECPRPPSGYAWEVLSANVDRDSGTSYGASALIQVGFASIGRGQFWDSGLSILNQTIQIWRQLKKNDQSTNRTMVEDAKLSVIIENVSATGTGNIVVHGTARLMKK